MSDQSKMIALVSREAAAALPEYKVDIQASADDAFVLCVRVYGVPKAQVEQVEMRVFDLEERLLPGTRYILLPMIKNLDITREYYPEYLPAEPAPGGATVAAYLQGDGLTRYSCPGVAAAYEAEASVALQDGRGRCLARQVDRGRYHTAPTHAAEAVTAGDLPLAA
jgi:hypothetical protein